MVSEWLVRPLESADAAAARALVAAQFSGTRYAERLSELLDMALASSNHEYESHVAADATTGAVMGFVVFGAVAGASGVCRIHGLVSEDEAVLRSLIVAARREQRLAICEVADDAPNRSAMRALAACEFADEGGVPDYFDDGVALRLFVRRQ
jgi:hypothetical protein